MRKVVNEGHAENTHSDTEYSKCHKRALRDWHSTSCLFYSLPKLKLPMLVRVWRVQPFPLSLSSHLSLNREGRWGTTDDFATSSFHFSLFSAALWNLANSRPVHSLMLSFHLFLCLHCLLPPFTVPSKMVLARPDERET